MAPGIGASGVVGLAIEATAGTYVAPAFYLPIESENLKITQETIFRRPIRGTTAAVVGAVAGNYYVEGDVTFEATEDAWSYLVRCTRATVVKSGAGPNFTYTATPGAGAIPSKTMSLTVVRNGVVFGYVGCVVGNYSFTVEDGLLKSTINVLGRDESVQSAPSATWPTTVPFGAGSYSIEIPTATPVTDTDTFDFSVDDAPSAQFRLKSTGRGADFISYGEQTVTASLERDFDNRTSYDAYKAVTAESITLRASKGANNSIELLMPAGIKETYDVGLAGQGDLVRAQITYQGTMDATGKPFQIVIKSQVDIT